MSALLVGQMFLTSLNSFWEAFFRRGKHSDVRNITRLRKEIRNIALKFAGKIVLHKSNHPWTHMYCSHLFFSCAPCRSVHYTYGLRDVKVTLQPHALELENEILSDERPNQCPKHHHGFSHINSSK